MNLLEQYEQFIKKTNNTPILIGTKAIQVGKFVV